MPWGIFSDPFSLAMKFGYHLTGGSACLTHEKLEETKNCDGDRRESGARTDLDEVWVGAPPEVTAAVIVWLATAAQAGERSGKTVQSHRLCAELELLPGWDGKEYRPPSTEPSD